MQGCAGKRGCGSLIVTLSCYTLRAPRCRQVRRVYFVLPEALSRRQPGARQACYRHFKGSQTWGLSAPQEELRQAAGGACIAILHSTTARA